MESWVNGNMSMRNGIMGEWKHEYEEWVMRTHENEEWVIGRMEIPTSLQMVPSVPCSFSQLTLLRWDCVPDSGREGGGGGGTGTPPTPPCGVGGGLGGGGMPGVECE